MMVGDRGVEAGPGGGGEQRCVETKGGGAEEGTEV